LPGSVRTREVKMERFTSECARLHGIVRRLARHQFPVADGEIPKDGFYFLFEAGEAGHDGDRIVRTGSHTGKGNLAVRLKEHMTKNKDRSIFRKNIGRALLVRNQDPFLDSWDRDLTKRADRDRYASSINLEKQNDVEEAVSDHIARHMSVSVIAAPTPDAALMLERLCISTVSRCAHCRASSHWLGNFSPNQKIRTSGLWQVHHLFGKVLSETDLRMIDDFSAPLKFR
jgi:hypothetical protein